MAILGAVAGAAPEALSGLHRGPLKKYRSFFKGPQKRGGMFKGPLEKGLACLKGP